MYKLLGAAYAGAPAGWPSWPGRASGFRLTLCHRARALHARQAGSRLPLTAEDGRAQISHDVPVQRNAQGTSAAAFVPMCQSLLAYHRRDNVPGQIRA
jgi:hypothetical protein